MKKKISTSTTNMQATYLRERIDSARRSAQAAINKLGKEKEPANVKAARALISKHEAAEFSTQKRLQKAANSVLEAETHKVKEAVLFGEPSKAMQTVVDFERRMTAKFSS